MTIKTNTVLCAAKKIGIAMVATSIFTITGCLAASQDAKAFGIGSITGYAEDLWEIGADATERAGRAIGKEARERLGGEITSNNPRRGRRVTGKPSESGNSRLPGARNPAGSSLPPARGAASSTSGGLPTSGNSALPPARGTASNSGSSLPPARGTSLPTGNAGLPPARGTTLPTGDSALPPPRRPSETVPVNPGQQPTPITEEDTKPSKPICNSKFENCHGNHDGHGHDGHGHHDHHGKKGKKAKKWKKGKKWSKHGARDKSIMGNPAGNGKKARNTSRNERTLKSKTGGKSVKIRVNNQKRSLRVMKKSNGSS